MLLINYASPDLKTKARKMKHVLTHKKEIIKNNFSLKNVEPVTFEVERICECTY